MLVRLHPLVQWRQSRDEIELCAPDFALLLDANASLLLRSLLDWSVPNSSDLEDIRALCEFGVVLLQNEWTDTHDQLQRLREYLEDVCGAIPLFEQHAMSSDIVTLVDEQDPYHYVASLTDASGRVFTSRASHRQRDAALLAAISDIYEQVSCDVDHNEDLVSKDVDNPFWKPLTGYAAWQWDESDFPFVDRPSGRWVDAMDVISGTRVQLPLETVCFPDGLVGSRCAAATSMGIKSHTSEREACLSSLYELIERDAMMVHWLGGITGEQIMLEDLFEDRVHRLQDFGFVVRLLNFSLGLAPVVFGFCTRQVPDGPDLLLGLASKPFMEDAIDEVLGSMELSFILGSKRYQLSDMDLIERRRLKARRVKRRNERMKRSALLGKLVRPECIPHSQIKSGPETYEAACEVLRSKKMPWYVCELNKQGSQRTAMTVVRSFVPDLVSIQLGSGRRHGMLERFDDMTTLFGGRGHDIYQVPPRG